MSGCAAARLHDDAAVAAARAAMKAAERQAAMARSTKAAASKQLRALLGRNEPRQYTKQLRALLGRNEPRQYTKPFRRRECSRCAEGKALPNLSLCEPCFDKEVAAAFAARCAGRAKAQT
jgi:hypothetical protein